MDDVMIANETVDEVKKKTSCIIFKANFEKAYNKLSWDFLIYMLERIGFCQVWWKNWIHEWLKMKQY